MPPPPAGEVTASSGATASSEEIADEASDQADAEATVTEVFTPDGEVQDESTTDPEPTAENGVVVADEGLSPEVADAAAAEVNAAEVTDGATAGDAAPGGESEPDPK